MSSPRGREEQLAALLRAAINAAEVAVHVEPEFTVAYGEMAVTLMALEKRRDAADWLCRGLAVLARQKAAPIPNRPGMDLLGSVSELERRFQSMLADIERV